MYLQKGDQALPAFQEYPNLQIGYGSICVENSLPG